jgi:TRAP-type mannitol/chloroaromatic compound transport system permease small subunit
VTKPRTTLVWSIVVTILFFFPTGLVALWFSLQAGAATDPEGAAQAGRIARRWIIASIVIGVLFWGIILAGLFLLGATNPLEA